MFDEPTAVLAESEAAHLLEAIKEIAAAGIAVLFITHRLNEIMEVCDNITVLRDGRHVVTKASKDTNVIELAELMVGRSMEFAGRKQHYSHKCPILEIKQLTVDMPGRAGPGRRPHRLRREILGISGLAGQGKIGIANGIMGLFLQLAMLRWLGPPAPKQPLCLHCRWFGLRIGRPARRGPVIELVH